MFTLYSGRCRNYTCFCVIFVKKMCIRVSRVINDVTNSQKHVDTPLLAVYHLFTQNLFILFAAFDLSPYPDNYYDKCNNKDNKDDSKGGIEHLFILIHNICVFGHGR